MTRELSPGEYTAEVSIIIPALNEEGSLAILYQRIGEVLEGTRYEIIFVDDGSKDSSWEVMDRLRLSDPRVKAIRFSRNFGKSEALAAGFKEARGEILITMDADLQDDPAEIPRLVATLAMGYDLVSGRKAHRRDPLSKTLPSRLFNWVTSTLTGVKFRDLNSGFKAYRRRVIEQVRVYGEQHRFIPALAHWKGFRVTEIDVEHHPRPFGKSKFGLKRFLAGVLDLFTVLFLTRFGRKPLHLFGSIGLACLAVGLGVNLYLSVIWLGGQSIGTRPLLQLGVLLIVTGIQFLSLGLLGEMLTLASAQGCEGGHIYEVFESLQPRSGGTSTEALSPSEPEEKGGRE